MREQATGFSLENLGRINNMLCTRFCKEIRFCKVTPGIHVEPSSRTFLYMLEKEGEASPPS